MLLEHIPVVEHSGRVRHIRNSEGSFCRNELQILQDVQVGLLDAAQALVIGNIGKDIRIYEIRIVDISSDSDDIRIVLTDKPGFQNSHCIIR